MSAPTFDEMTYTRPNPRELKAQLADLSEQLAEASSYDEARAVFLEKEKLESHVRTLASLVFLRHSIDTRDSFYEQERQFWDELMPELEESLKLWSKTLLRSKFRDEFEREFGRIMFVNDEISERAFSPEIIPEMQAENKLTTEYARIIASAQIPFQGKTYTLSQLTPFKTDANNQTRLDAWKAEGQWYKEHQADFDRIYDELTHLRDAMAKRLGRANYVSLGYDRMLRNCYDQSDVEKFRQAVLRYVVPLATKIYQDQAQRLGVEYPLSFADAALMFRSGNARPKGTPDEIVAQVKTFYDELSSETSEFFSTMLDQKLMDLVSAPGKEGGGYCTSLYEYEVPFIFANFNGTEDDIDVMTHEAGHAFANWINRKRIPISYVWPTMEACEVHSMSMEFFAWPWCERFFVDDTRKYLYSHLASSLVFIPYGTMVDHFQHIIYEKPTMSPEQRHKTWKELLASYMPWMRLDGEIPFYAEGEGWQRQSHIYESPFYYIDYCLAQTVALEFWAMIQEDRERAWKHYMAYTELGGSKSFTELLDEAGLVSPFDENCLRDTCEKAGRWLENYDLSGIE